MSDKYELRDGMFVSQRVAQVVEAIREYSPELEVQWVPPSARTEGGAAFKIMHYPPGGQPYAIFHVQNEDEFDTRVLMRIIQGDQRQGRIHLSDIEAAEAAAKAVAQQRFRDEIEEKEEIAAAILRSNKNTYKVNDNLVVSDYKRGNQAPKTTYL